MFAKTYRLFAVAGVVGVCGCGSSSHGTTTSAPAGSSESRETGAALAPDARSAATGDIPDTQNFLTLVSPRLHVSMLYPEGWTVREVGARVSIVDKNNLVSITLSTATRPTLADVRAQLRDLARTVPTLSAGAPAAVTIESGPAVKVTYTTKSAPNPVTGKQVTLTVDRYVLSRHGKVAVVDLGTPVGVDNVDAYKRMIASFRWR